MSDERYDLTDFSTTDDATEGAASADGDAQDATASAGGDAQDTTASAGGDAQDTTASVGGDAQDTTASAGDDAQDTTGSDDDAAGTDTTSSDSIETSPERPAVLMTPSSGDGTDVIIDGDSQCAVDGITFKNWRARRTDRSWPGNVMTQEFGWSHRGAPRPIDTIVIHETGAPSGFARTDCGVHFLVNNDATVYQLGDLKARFNHASNAVINNKSIGIELANDTYFAFSRDGERLPIKWRGANRAIRIPLSVQLEAIVTLLDILMQRYGVDRWLNATIAPGYFILATNGMPIDPQPSGSKVVEPVEVGGLVTHSIIRGHGDGGFVALYAWLRLSGGLDPDDALAEAKRIASGDPADVATVRSTITTPNAAAITMMPV